MTVVEWDAAVSVMFETWGTHEQALAREGPRDVVVIAWNFLAMRGVWDEPQAELLVLLEACYLSCEDRLIGKPEAAPQFGARSQGSDLADIFEVELWEATWSLLPIVRCFCGTEYKAVGGYGKHVTYESVDHELCVSTDRGGQCGCGRLMSQIGQHEQTELALGV